MLLLYCYNDIWKILINLSHSFFFYKHLKLKYWQNTEKLRKLANYFKLEIHTLQESQITFLLTFEVHIFTTLDIHSISHVYRICYFVIIQKRITVDARKFHWMFIFSFYIHRKMLKIFWFFLICLRALSVFNFFSFFSININEIFLLGKKVWKCNARLLYSVEKY